MPGADQTILQDLESGIPGNVISVLNPQRFHIVPGKYHLVQTDQHVLFLPLQGPGIVKHMDGRGLGQRGSRIGSAVSGVDGAVFPLHALHGITAYGHNPQRTVGIDGAHHRAQGIAVGRQTEPGPGAAGYTDHQRSPAGVGYFIAHVPGVVPQHFHQPAGKTGGAGYIYNFFQIIDHKLIHCGAPFYSYF